MRLKQFLRRILRFQRLKQAGVDTAKLLRTGCIAAVVYGEFPTGVPPTALIDQRRAATPALAHPRGIGRQNVDLALLHHVELSSETNGGVRPFRATMRAKTRRPKLEVNVPTKASHAARVCISIRKSLNLLHSAHALWIACAWCCADDAKWLRESFVMLALSVTIAASRRMALECCSKTLPLSCHRSPSPSARAPEVNTGVRRFQSASN